jgi:hypothetical protein
MIIEDDVRRTRRLGWIAVGISTAITSFWAFWGIIENFHEGWYSESLWANLGMLLLQYLAPMLIFMGLALVSIIWPRAGGVTHGLLALLAVWFFRAFSVTATCLIVLPLLGLGVLHYLGRPQPRRTAIVVVLGVPLLTLVIAGIEPALRVSQRVDNGSFGMRYVEGNGVALYWAPAGPGWPVVGGDWFAAQEACHFLREDGLTLAAVQPRIWRLPTVEEAVRSMARHGQNSGGEWDEESASAIYDRTPDKEPPLWNVHSPVIYWWTATEIDDGQAYIIVYDGKVWPRSKELGPDNLGFRCVKEIEAPN